MTLIFTCEECGENLDIKYRKHKDPDICDSCQAINLAGLNELMDHPGYFEEKTCNCEDWPCCGH
jgi:hypothetical protein